MDEDQQVPDTGSEPVGETPSVEDQTLEASAVDKINEVLGEIESGEVDDSLGDDGQVEGAGDATDGDEAGSDEGASEQEATEPPATDPDVDQTVLHLAGLAGLTEEQARAMHQSGALYEFTKMVLSQTPPQYQEGDSGGEGAVEDQAKFDLGLGDDFSDELTGALNKIVEHFSTQLNEVRHHLREHDSLRDVIMEDRRDERMQWFDGQLGELGDGWNQVFGAGPTTSIKPGSVEYANRISLVEAMDMISRGNPRMDRDEQFRLAVAAKFPKKFESAAEDRIKQQVKSQSGKRVRRPTGRTLEASGPPEERAASKVAEAMEAM